MFGTLQLFHLVKNHKDFAKKVHKLSRDERQVRHYSLLLFVNKGLFLFQYFPFSVVSLNFTKVALQTMRSGILSSKFNKRGEILPVLNELLMGMYYELYIHWYGPFPLILLASPSSFFPSPPSSFLHLFLVLIL